MEIESEDSRGDNDHYDLKDGFVVDDDEPVKRKGHNTTSSEEDDISAGTSGNRKFGKED